MAPWNYAQHFSMNDNSYDTEFGPSTVGALNLVAGQTEGKPAANGEIVGRVVIGDPDPLYDDCGSPIKWELSGRISATCSTLRDSLGVGLNANSNRANRPRQDRQPSAAIRLRTWVEFQAFQRWRSPEMG